MKTINQISNLIILTLVNYARDYPWASYIANSLSQFDLMELNELQNRLTNIITGISNLGPRIIQGITQGFIKYYIPDQIWVISITDIEGIEQTAIEYYTWYKTFQGFQHLP
jgi:hypothetical protein